MFNITEQNTDKDAFGDNSPFPTYNKKLYKNNLDGINNRMT